MAGARQIVPAPGFTTLPFGLWDAVEDRSASGDHWQQGVNYIERCSVAATVYEECIAVTGTGGQPAAQASKAATFSQTNRAATAFTVYTEFDCSPVGNEELTAANIEAFGTAALARVEQWQVERSFWTGVAGKAGTTDQVSVFPHLAANAALDEQQGNGSVIRLQTAASSVVTGTGVDVADGLGQLEATLADCYHGQGVIHIPVELLPTFKAWKLVEREGDALYTPAGNRLVVGAGYTGSSPAGAASAAGQAWIYATGALFGYRGSVKTFSFVESFDRSKNTVKALAERTYLLGWECCHLAANVAIGVPT